MRAEREREGERGGEQKERESLSRLACSIDLYATGIDTSVCSAPRGEGEGGRHGAWQDLGDNG